MNVYKWLIAGFWVVFIAYWAAMAFRTKRTVGTRPRLLRQVGLRVLVIAVILLMHRLAFLNHALRQLRGDVLSSNALAGLIGAILCGIGVGFAVWARTILGTNWGMPMSRKENPELVTSGPYAFVRHPIYTGILCAMTGSAIGESAVWVIPLIFFGIYFLYSARSEEKLMTEEFPNTYPPYVRRTKMLVPFVL